MLDENHDEARARRRGRTVGLVLFASLVTAFIVVCSVQVMQQVWAPETVRSELSCEDGALSLIGALRRARERAAPELGERESLRRFRKALLPEWASSDFFSVKCKSQPKIRAALRAVTRVRYAEEHALRYEAADIAGLRRDLDRVERGLRPRNSR